ncbi:DUF1292 domain-containing protein [Weissella halotolerans]|uniref:UPF0473 protein IV68_GL000490 n=1 Tax=Weissella halotolerans DSM 20190 TaxID=1123500 RepID=A0A0R2FYX6_9LACO|nr:DUF1292 domain-containing protein [Weissella halotolerans]KRN33682.1 hypothetical protein IV68_GL000490 [Weissella halotolerans DSM 20190]
MKSESTPPEVFMLTDDQGQEHAFTELFSFKVDQTGKSYIALAADDVNEDGESDVLAFIYDPEKDDGLLLPIESDDEYAMVEDVLATLMDEGQLD